MAHSDLMTSCDDLAVHEIENLPLEIGLRLVPNLDINVSNNEHVVCMLPFKEENSPFELRRWRSRYPATRFTGSGCKYNRLSELGLKPSIGSPQRSTNSISEIIEGIRLRACAAAILSRSSIASEIIAPNGSRCMLYNRITNARYMASKFSIVKC